MMKKYRWGMIGLGDIATQFAAGFSNEASELYGVSARSFPKVQAFAEKYAIPMLMKAQMLCWKIRKLILCTLQYLMIFITNLL